MSLYPSLEDMQMHKMIQAQQSAMNSYEPQQPYAPQNAYPPLMSVPTPTAPYDTAQNTSTSELYPGLTNFMGLELSRDMIALNMPEYMQTVAVPSKIGMIAPLSSQTAGLQRAQVTHGIREVIVCKGADKKIGLRVKDINNGIFITMVCKESPAALVGYVFQCISKNVFNFNSLKFKISNGTIFLLLLQTSFR